MKEKIKTFLILFLVFWIVFTLKAYKPEKGIFLNESLMVASVGSVIISIVIVVIINNLPKQTEKIFERKTYQTLIKDGFRRHNDSLIGVYKNYTAILNIQWNLKTRPLIEITILFDPESYGHYFTKDEFGAIVEKNTNKDWYGLQNKWTINSVSGYVLFGFFREPSYEKIINKVNQLIDILIAEKLCPISDEQLMAKVSLIEKHYTV